MPPLCALAGARLPSQLRSRLRGPQGARRPQSLRRSPAVTTRAARHRPPPAGSGNGAGSGPHLRRHRRSLSSSDYGNSGDAGEAWVDNLPPLTSMDPAVMLPDRNARLAPAPAWRRSLNDWAARLQYAYFNWRQDTWSDLQLFVLLNVAVFTAGAFIQGAVIRAMDDTLPGPPPDAGPLRTLWFNLYQVLEVVLGQDLPAGQAGLPSQLFAVCTAVFGLASFALVLALIEQWVLEVLEVNVKRGSSVFEAGHTVVLAWCESSRDIAQLTRVLTQLCAANRAVRGGAVVVLTQHRGKLEMEQLFREVVPERCRYGTRFVFRQGSPLDPAALHLVAAPDAQRIIVCGDYSRQAKDADAQVLRTCVLLDEMVQQEHASGGGPAVVAQIRTQDALPLVRYACSLRVVPVSTNVVNARRYVRLLHNPIAAVFSRCLMDQYSPAHAFIDACPQVEGLRFGDLAPYFPDSSIVGLCNPAAGACQLNPPPERVVQPGEHLVALRPGSASRSGFYVPRAGEAARVDMGSGWSPERYCMRSHDEQPLGVEPPYVSPAGISARASERALGAGSGHRDGPAPRLASTAAQLDRSSAQGLFVLPLQYSNPLVAADELLICGWMGTSFMLELLAELDHSDQGLPPGSRVVLFNEHTWDPHQFEERLAQRGIRQLSITHVRGDPRSRADMARHLDVARFKAAMVVCDSLWAEGEGGNAADADRGLHMLSQADMLSLDSAVLMVQLNIRLLLEEAGHPSISIICEKLTYVGVTRFEDDTRLPLGLAVNSASYAAKALTQVAVDPRFLCAYMQLGKESDLADAGGLAGEGEELSYLQLQARAASVRQVLLGYYRIPASSSEPLEVVVNPQGAEERARPQVWNNGDSRCKLVTLALTKHAAAAQAAARAAEAPLPGSASGGASAAATSDLE